jgi:hypothetical protein
VYTRGVYVAPNRHGVGDETGTVLEMKRAQEINGRGAGDETGAAREINWRDVHYK